MKTVFLIEHTIRYEGTEILEIFSSHQAAENFCLDYIKDIQGAMKIADDRWSAGLFASIKIKEREVRDW